MGSLHFNDVWMWCRAARLYLVVDNTNKGEPATSGSHIKYTFHASHRHALAITHALQLTLSTKISSLSSRHRCASRMPGLTRPRRRARDRFCEPAREGPPYYLLVERERAIQEARREARLVYRIVLFIVVLLGRRLYHNTRSHSSRRFISVGSGGRHRGRRGGAACCGDVSGALGGRPIGPILRWQQRRTSRRLVAALPS